MLGGVPVVRPAPVTRHWEVDPHFACDRVPVEVAAWQDDVRQGALCMDVLNLVTHEMHGKIM
eukprot:11089102-Lingulodinium_polyedra.AAC.1